MQKGDLNCWWFGFQKRTVAEIGQLHHRWVGAKVACSTY